jgi:hypothetical protein
MKVLKPIVTLIGAALLTMLVLFILLGVRP